jgi:hypothetical protein
MRPALIFAPAVMLAVAATAFAEKPKHLGPLYTAMATVSRLNNKAIKEELKITKEQEKGIEAAWKPFWEQYGKELDARRKLTGPDKEAKEREMDMKQADAFFQSLTKTLKPEQIQRLKQITYQWLGTRLLYHPEIREQLKISEKEADQVNEAYEKMLKAIEAEAKAAKLSPEAIQKKYAHLAFGVPEKVQGPLSEEQRKKLKELLGEPYKFNP